VRVRESSLLKRKEGDLEGFLGNQKHLSKGILTSDHSREKPEWGGITNHRKKRSSKREGSRKESHSRGGGFWGERWGGQGVYILEY